MVLSIFKFCMHEIVFTFLLEKYVGDGGNISHSPPPPPLFHSPTCNFTSLELYICYLAFMAYISSIPIHHKTKWVMRLLQFSKVAICVVQIITQYSMIRLSRNVCTTTKHMAWSDNLRLVLFMHSYMWLIVLL